jgi:hypothetical protein
MFVRVILPLLQSQVSELDQSPPMPSLTTTLGGTIAAVCSRCRSRRNYEFAMDWRSTVVRRNLPEVWRAQQQEARRLLVSG